MDDGSKRSKNSYVIYTCSFTIEEHNILLDILLKKYNIQAIWKFSNNKQKKYPYIHISKNSSKNNSHIFFRNLIKPYIIDSMKYKL